MICTGDASTAKTTTRHQGSYNLGKKRRKGRNTEQEKGIKPTKRDQEAQQPPLKLGKKKIRREKKATKQSKIGPATSRGRCSSPSGKEGVPDREERKNPSGKKGSLGVGGHHRRLENDQAPEQKRAGSQKQVFSSKNEEKNGSLREKEKKPNETQEETGKTERLVKENKKKKARAGGRKEKKVAGGRSRPDVR